ncbi:flagellar filament capping protein FliD [Variovorax ginsengisoli]|uniref:Flagellar hook-associated protein 2 n=1 Tax=Variovorax ginsengisoli TaxID=363844 RepID=A0ABT9SD80_9BURK|nr:flagellar filament capping protein FliD [Variovorax ginsengisoli]MDP9902304.1 flagellar hook-associated protein 2 [Variovorax ginsengisoli]
MASISSLGIGSGLDLTTLLSNLTTAESQPLVALQSRQTSFVAKLSAYGVVQNSLSTLQTAAKVLADPTLFQASKASVGNASVLSAAPSATSVAGNYAVNVTQLAQSQTLITQGQTTATTAIGSGVVTFDFGTITNGTLDSTSGTYSGASFTADSSRKAVSVTIDSTNNTLQGVRDAINKSGAGVTASIVNDGSGTPYRLVLTSTQTGKASSMRVAVTGDTALQSLLANDPAGTQNLKQTAVAQNAELTVGGIAVTSGSNTVSEAIQGTSLTLLATGSSSVNVQQDSSPVVSAVNALVSAYNGLQSTAASLTNYDKSTQKAAALLGDSSLRTMQSRIRSLLSSPPPGASSSLQTLSAIGISFQKDGTLSVDSTKLNTALSTNPAGVASLFSSAGTSTDGYGKQLSSMIDGFTAVGGTLKAAQDGMNATIKKIDNEYTNMQARVDARVATYKAQFSALDTAVSSMNNTLSYLTTQFDAMNGTSSSSSSSSSSKN